MNNIKHGGPAFPVPDIDGGAVQEGMTLRDYFASMLIADEIKRELANANGYNYNSAAYRAYFIADAMLKARNEI